MSKATEDLGRLAVTKFVKRAIESEASATRDTEQEIVRRVLDAWAKERHQAFRVYAKSLRADGLQLELDGIGTEDDGLTSGRRK